MMRVGPSQQGHRSRSEGRGLWLNVLRRRLLGLDVGAEKPPSLGPKFVKLFVQRLPPPGAGKLESNEPLSELGMPS